MSKKRTELNLLQRIWLEILWVLARLFAVLPYWFKYYVVENLIFFIQYYFRLLFLPVRNRCLRGGKTCDRNTERTA